MMWKSSMVAAVALTVAAGTPSQPAWSETGGVKAGVLTCNVDSGWGFVFGSSRDLKCIFSDNGVRTERYTGHINRYGIDIGYKAAGVMVWTVLAPTGNLEQGALAGNYGGISASAAVGIGAGANLLVGGSNRTVSLQPLSVEGLAGLNLAAGIAGLVLNAVDEGS